MATDETSDRNPRRTGLRPSRIAAWLVLATTLFAVLGFLWLVHENRDETPNLTTADLDAAVERWQRNGPASYLLEMQTSPRNDRIQLEVHQGRPTMCKVNGLPPKERRTWKTWTVPRQFDYIRDDLSHSSLAGEPVAILRAEFDLENGLPRYYHHVAGGEQVENGWRITRFQPLPDSGPLSP